MNNPGKKVEYSAVINYYLYKVFPISERVVGGEGRGGIYTETTFNRRVNFGNTFSSQGFRGGNVATPADNAGN
jgi:hypothetical protein